MPYPLARPVVEDDPWAPTIKNGKFTTEPEAGVKDALMDGFCTRPLVQLACRYNVPVPVNGVTEMLSVVVAPEVT